MTIIISRLGEALVDYLSVFRIEIADALHFTGKAFVLRCRSRQECESLALTHDKGVENHLGGCARISSVIGPRPYQRYAT